MDGEWNSNPLQYSCLENPMDRRAWWSAFYGVAQSQTRLKQLSSSSSNSSSRPHGEKWERMPKRPKYGDKYWIIFCEKNFCKAVQLSSVAQLCLTLCNPMNCSTPGLPVHHQLPESTQTHVHRVSDAIQPSHSLLSPSPPALNLSRCQSLFPMSQLFTSGGQSIRVSALTSVLPMNSQDWSPLGWTGSPCSPRDSQESPPTP